MTISDGCHIARTQTKLRVEDAGNAIACCVHRLMQGRPHCCVCVCELEVALRNRRVQACKASSIITWRRAQEQLAKKARHACVKVYKLAFICGLESSLSAIVPSFQLTFLRNIILTCLPASSSRPCRSLDGHEELTCSTHIHSIHVLL